MRRRRLFTLTAHLRIRVDLVLPEQESLSMIRFRALASAPIFAAAVLLASLSAPASSLAAPADEGNGAAVPAPAMPHRPEGLKLPPARAFAPPQPTKHALACGLTVFLLEDHELPLVHVAATVRTGSVYEPEDKLGLAAITGQVMRSGGTETHPADRLDEELDQKAISVEVSIGESSGTATLSCLAESFDAGLAILSDVLQHPAFPQEKLELARSLAKSEIARRNDEANDIAGREFQKAVYGASSPWARTSELATIDRIRREDLVAFHQAAFHPDRTILGVAGDFDSAVMLKKLEAAFAGWARASTEPPPLPGVDAKASGSSGVYLVRKEDVNQFSILVGHLSVKRDNPDYAALVLLDNVLGSGGFSSRLFNHIREQRGLAYDVHSELGAGFDHVGIFQIVAQTKSESTAAVIQAALDEVREIRERPVTEAELAQARESFLNSSVFYYDSKSEVLARHLRYEYYGLPHELLERLLEQIRKVTVADLQRVAAQYLHPESFTILVVGHDADFDKPLSTFGPVKEIPLVSPKAGGAKGAGAGTPAGAQPEGTGAAGTGAVPPKDNPPAGAAAAEPEKAVAGPAEPADSPETRARAAEVVTAAVAAHGGRDALAAIKDLKLKTRVTVATPQGELQLAGSLALAFPDRIRMSVLSPMGAIVQVFDGKAGWIQTPQGTQKMDATDTEETRNAVARHWVRVLVDLADGKAVARHAGTRDLGGRKVDLLFVQLAGGNTCSLAVDAETHRLARQWFGPAGMEEEERYDDYRDVEKLPFPHHWIVSQGGEKRLEVKASDVKLNPGLADKDFERPAPKKPKESKEKEGGAAPQPEPKADAPKTEPRA
ncbi:MAG: insulinase family protein [Planctomycetes bacterium]|nr:insulinase family protein [Planctomycetota bacterium]